MKSRHSVFLVFPNHDCKPRTPRVLRVDKMCGDRGILILWQQRKASCHLSCGDIMILLRDTPAWFEKLLWRYLRNNKNDESHRELVCKGPEHNRSLIFSEFVPSFTQINDRVTLTTPVSGEYKISECHNAKEIVTELILAINNRGSTRTLVDSICPMLDLGKMTHHRFAYHLLPFEVASYNTRVSLVLLSCSCAETRSWNLSGRENNLGDVWCFLYVLKFRMVFWGFILFQNG